MIARMDAVVTTRLHGTVLAMKHGVPAVVIDPVAGGHKVARQARTIGWDTVFTADALDDGQLSAALDFCLSPAGRRQAARVRVRAIHAANAVKDAFLEAVATQEREASGRMAASMNDAAGAHRGHGARRDLPVRRRVLGLHELRPGPDAPGA